MKHNFSSAIEGSLEGRSSTPPADKTPSREESPVKAKNAMPPKHAGGRPTNASKGIQKRKQYTLTLLPEMYEKTLAAANEEGISFSKYVERAINEYQHIGDNH